MAIVIPNPDDFTVDIREDGDTWIVQVNEAPEVRGEGATLREAIEDAKTIALRPLTTLAATDRSGIPRAVMLAHVLDEWAEDFEDQRDSDAAIAEGPPIPWDDVKEDLGL